MVKVIKPENIEQLMKGKKSSEIIRSSFLQLKPTKETYRSFIFILIISLIPAGLIGFSSETIHMTKSAMEAVIGVILALLGIMFTGYAFFQALINDSLLVWMLGDAKCKSKSMLQETNEYFAEVMMLEGISIFVSLFFIISLGCLPSDWSLPSITKMNNLIASSLIWLYFAFNFLVVWEVKSFIFNLFQLFNAHAAAKALAIFDDAEDK